MGNKSTRSPGGIKASMGGKIINKHRLAKGECLFICFVYKSSLSFAPKAKRWKKATSIAINASSLWLILYLYSSLLHFLTGGSGKLLTQPKLPQDSINKKETHINTNIKSRCQSEGRDWCLGFMFKQPSRQGKKRRRRDRMENKLEEGRREGGVEEKRGGKGDWGEERREGEGRGGNH